MLSVAEDEVHRTLRGLPEALRTRAVQVPVIFEKHPSRDLRKCGIDKDTLGLFTGDAYHDVGWSMNPSPNSILLFLTNLWIEAGENEPAYRREVRTTLLHELGHYLGLDEDDLEDRGLR